MGAVMAVSGISVTAAAETFESADKAVRSINAGINLGNTLDSCGEWIGLYTEAKPSDYETAWGNPVTTPEIIRVMKSAGFDAIRVPVTWAEHIDEKGNIDKVWLDRVQEVVDYVLAEDLYCIINVHHDAGSEGWLEASSECVNNKKFSNLWRNIAIRFKDYDERLMFESFNEMLDSQNSWTSPRMGDAFDAINSFNQQFVDAVRTTGGNNTQRNLMLQTYSASTHPLALANFEMPEDIVQNHLIVQIHNYDPAGFTSLDATWTTLTDKWGTDEEKAYFDDLFETLGDFSDEIGAPVVVGEFAANYKGNEPARELYAEYFVTAAKKEGIKCFWWETGDMALIDRVGLKVKYPGVTEALTGVSVTADSPVKYGDANGDGYVNSIDASEVLKYCVGLGTPADLKAADANKDGNVNSLDASEILRIVIMG